MQMLPCGRASQGDGPIQEDVPMPHYLIQYFPDSTAFGRRLYRSNKNTSDGGVNKNVSKAQASRENDLDTGPLKCQIPETMESPELIIMNGC